ncbi:MAG: hypothetical protein ACSLFP_08255, partial [Acidimicrobiales bacterium]
HPTPTPTRCRGGGASPAARRREQTERVLASDSSPYRVLWELAWWVTKAVLALGAIALIVAVLLVGLLTLIRRARDPGWESD